MGISLRLSTALPLMVLCALQGCRETTTDAVPIQGQAAVALGPWLLDVAPAQVTVAWTTQAPVIGEVAFGQAGSFDRAALEQEARTEHRVALTGLSGGQRYEYRIAGDLPAGGSFATPPVAGAASERPFRVLVYGDNRTNGGDHDLVVRAAEAEQADVALHTGDMVVNAKDGHLWQRWFEVERTLLSRTPIFPTVGNHEITDKGAAYSLHFQQKGMPTWRAVDYGPLHVLVLDSFDMGGGADPHLAGMSEAQRAWAETDVKSLGADRQLWVLVHQGPYAHPKTVRPGHGGSDKVLSLLHSLNKVHPIRAIFAGHEHYYERGLIDGLHYFVIGGGGAPLEEPDPAAPGVLAARKALSFAVIDVCGCHANGKVKDITGHVIDSFVVSDCPIACRAAASGTTEVVR